MKHLKLKSLLAFTFLAQQVLAGDFDITYAQHLDVYPTYSNSSTSASVMTGYGDAVFQMSSMERYVLELEDSSERQGHYMDILHVENMNSDLTDNRAYAILTEIEFFVDTNGDGIGDKRYFHGDIISGSDWDNNGFIDCLEIITIFDYNSVEIEM